MDRRAYLRGVGGLAAVGLAGCSGVLAESDGDYDVGMTAKAFDPPTVEVSAGDTVVWKNTSTHAHTVTAREDGLPEGAAFFASGGFADVESAEKSWRSSRGGAIYSDETFEHVFEVPGRYAYYCIPHEASAMVGTVVVSE